MHNVLFVGAGRRVSLAEDFRNEGFEVFSYELGETVPISVAAHVVLGLKFGDINFKPHIEAEIQKNRITLVVPLQDDAVHKCSLITTCKVVGSGTEASEICLDKVLFEEWCLENFPGFYPYHDGSATYPKIYKPRFGFGSRGIKIAHDHKDDSDLCDYSKKETHKRNLVVQRFIDGKEYSVDAYFDPTSKMVDAVPRERIKVANGEVISSRTIENPKLQEMTKLIGEKMGLKGPTCFQYIIGEDKVPYVMEVNARFGGGAILSMYAGLPMIKLIKHDYYNHWFNYEPNKWRRNVLMERANREFFYEP